jgi:uncharacterized protein YggE
MRTLWLAAALAATSSTQLQGQFGYPDPRSQMVTASGTAEVRRPPDFAVITVGLLARGSSPGGTASELDRLLATVRDTLRAHGLADSTVVGVREIEPQRTYPEHEITGYTAGVSLKISLRDLAKLGQLLDALAGAGATEIPEVKYKSDHEDAAYDEAVAKAVADATRRAQASAKAAGGRLGQVILLQVDGRSGMDYDYLDFTDNDTEAPRAREASANKTAHVTIYWRFEGR